MNNPEQLIARFNLLPHPEGGFYAETYKSTEHIQRGHLPERFSGNRSFSTAIYFLLPRGNFSAFHRIKSDECWHFYAGETLLVHIIHPTGKLETIHLGSNTAEGEIFQFVVPAGCWFASEPAPETSFSFVGCTVAPGFDFADFELAKADELCAAFPGYEAIITRLCRQ